jgi:hypothetical protein
MMQCTLIGRNKCDSIQIAHNSIALAFKLNVFYAKMFVYKNNTKEKSQKTFFLKNWNFPKKLKNFKNQ